MRRLMRPTIALALSMACKSDPAPLALDAAPSAPRLTFVTAPEGDVAMLVKNELARAEGTRVLVYVGASWCEPCRRFHETAQTGALDPMLPPIRFLEFDLDKDEERLRAAGYVAKYIPLFAVPQRDGRASGKQIAGSVKGAGAPAEITPRLRALLNEG